MLLTLPATYSPPKGYVHPLRRFGHAALLHQQLQTEQQIEIKRGDGFLHERQRASRRDEHNQQQAPLCSGNQNPDQHIPCADTNHRRQPNPQ